MLLMDDKVGTKTGQKTKAGRDVYKTPEGESVSEKSVTIKFDDNAYVNAPSIHNGKQYTEEEIKEMLLEGTIKPTSRHDTLEEALEAARKRSSSLMKEGGMAKRMAKQMELFEPVERGFDEGGLMDEGGTTDPVSGNEVPPGSTQEEVRDDIPAQLSEGEFVFPADVVRYIGLEKLMMMRQEAKQGLSQMEAMGQMGNSEEATVQDDLPFDMYDLDVEDDSLTMQQGGFVNPQTGTYQIPGTGITGFQQAPMSTTGFNPTQPIQPYFTPTQFTQAQYQDPLQVTNIPTFGDTVGSGFGQYDEMKTFINDAGQVMQVPFKDGKPLYPIPEGYSEQKAQPSGDSGTPTQQTGVQTTQVRDEGGGRSEEDMAVSIAGEAIDKQTDIVKDRYAISGRRGVDLLSFVPGGNFIKEVFEIDDFFTVGKKDPDALPTALGGPSAPFGPADLSGLPESTSPYLTEDSVRFRSAAGLQGSNLTAAQIEGMTPAQVEAAFPGTKADMDILPASAAVARNVRRLSDYLGVQVSRYAGYEKGDLDPSTGGFFDKNGIAIDIRTGGQAKSDNGSMSYASFGDYKEALEAGSKSGWRGGVIDSKTYEGLGKKGKQNYDKFADIMGYEKGGGTGVTTVDRDGREGIDRTSTDPAAGTSAPEGAIGYEGQDMSGGDASGGQSSDASADTSAADDSYGDDFGGSVFKSGGLAKQMKQSGLASKK